MGCCFDEGEIDYVASPRTSTFWFPFEHPNMLLGHALSPSPVFEVAKMQLHLSTACFDASSLLSHSEALAVKLNQYQIHQSYCTRHRAPWSSFYPKQPRYCPASLHCSENTRSLLFSIRVHTKKQTVELVSIPRGQIQPIRPRVPRQLALSVHSGSRARVSLHHRRSRRNTIHQPDHGKMAATFRHTATESQER